MLRHVGLLLPLQLELTLQRVGRVVAGPEADPAAVQRRDLVHDLVEQVPVVGDGDDRPLEAACELLHPSASLVVEVGLGLVEQQHVGLLLEAGGQRDQLSLPSGECDRRLLELFCGEPDLEQRRSGASLRARTACLLEPSEHLLLTREDPRHASEVGDDFLTAELRCEQRELVFQLCEIGAGGDNRLERGSRIACRMLVEVGNPSPAPTRDVSLVRILETGEDLQKGRLAASVGADDTDPGLRLDGEVEPGEDRARAEGLGDGVGGEERHSERSVRDRTHGRLTLARVLKWPSNPSISMVCGAFWRSLRPSSRHSWRSVRPAR